MVFLANNSWRKILNDELESIYLKKLSEFVDQEYATKTIFPPKDEIFSAFEHCKLEDLKVVILGQDPYHGFGQANGLCFSVRDDVKIPPSLKNIFKEIDNEYDCGIPNSGNLSRWAKQGVLLLNATLTVEEKKPGSHQKKGWERFTDEVISLISEQNKNIVFLLWGSYAQKKVNLINSEKHCILTSAHPSPLSSYRGFFGNNHFKLVNEYLKSKGKKQIDW